jgi:type IV pilus assembly protein PilY1
MIQFISKLLASSMVIFLLLLSTFSFSEDIELYISETIKQSQTRPKVLVIFDNSGSMGTEEFFKKAYNPGNNYDALAGLTKRSGKHIYYSKGGDTTPVPDSPSENRLFLDEINGCKTARDILNQYGIYTGRVREYTFQGNSGRWAEIPDKSGNSIKLLDCEDDVISLNNENGKIKDNTGGIVNLPTPQNGFPVDAFGDQSNPQYYTAQADDSNVSWSGQLITLYTDNYLRWQKNPDIPTEQKSRLEVAKESVTNLINSSPNVDFGLQVFNRNNGRNYRNGGRVVHGIQESTLTSRASLLDIINNNISADTWTPLCETLYEATRYFAGKTIDFGNDHDVTPYRDQSIEEGSSYKSPFTSCSDRIYVVLITDGEPTYDIDANDEIFDLPVSGQDTLSTADNYYVGGPSNRDSQYSYLAALAGWIRNNDLNLNLDGKQTAETYTIGFSSGADSAAGLLRETAERGGGKYFKAEDSASLTAALANVLASLEPSNDSLTSASVAANNFDRTETLDSVYYAMFQPDRGPRWQGNLKKYKVVNGKQLGANNVLAVNDDGYFSEDVQSYWSNDKDGDSVNEGGVAEMLRNKGGRKIWSDLGSTDAPNKLIKLQYADATSSLAYPTQADLAADLDVSDTDANKEKNQIKDMLNWINGSDVDDVNNNGEYLSEARPDVFGDPLHSKPVVINYGNDDVFIVVGTNHGVLHMFKDDDASNTIDESWAFMPKTFISNIKPLRENFTSADKIYGVDGLITAHIIDNNGDGIVNGADKVWLFFGLRRGGNMYYAIDITNPTTPRIMWKIEGGSGDFSELGQTWSQPKVIYSKLNIASGKAKPTLLFGGGYAPSKDAKSVGGKNGADNQGKAIYMVDAETGALVWSLAPTGDTTFTGVDSIPASIGSLDSDGDGYTDRLYAGDTGGNVWRVDMPGTDKSKFSVFKLASLGNGGGTGGTQANDRRFFSEPDIVRAYITETINSGKKDSGGKDIIVQQDIPYDAILIGSGDRTNPISTNNDDKFFMIKDIHIKTQQFTSSTLPAIPDTIILSDLADYTGNPFDQVLTTQERETLSLEVSLKMGWFIDFEQSGEKNTSKSLVINNVVYFTSYTPPTLGVDSISCNLPNGQGWLYAVDLALGLNKYNWAAEDARNRDDRIAFISEQFLDSPTLIVTDKLDTDTGKVESDGNIIVGRKIMPVGFKLQTLRTYLVIQEN